MPRKNNISSPKELLCKRTLSKLDCITKKKLNQPDQSYLHLTDAINAFYIHHKNLKFIIRNVISKNQTAIHMEISYIQYYKKKIFILFFHR